MDLVDELQNEFGRSLTAKELARLLRVDPRTINRHAHLWGGIEVSPNHYRFFEKSIKRVIRNGNDYRQKGQAAIHKPDHGQWSQKGQVVAERQYGIKTRRHAVGTRNKKAARAGIDRHKMFVDHRLDQ